MGFWEPNANEATQTTDRSGGISLVLGICARCILCGVDACRERAEKIVSV